MKHPLSISTAFKLPVLGLLASLVACGGGGSSDGVSTATISGAIVAAPVSGAKVRVIDAKGNEVVEAVTTNASGQYTLSIPTGSLGQDLIVKSTGGTYTDEVTRSQNIAAGEMFAYVSANSLSNGSSVSATPGSTIIADLVMNYGKSLAEAQADFTSAFGYTSDISIAPVDATVLTTTASIASKRAGYRAAAFSQLNLDLFLNSDQQFDMIAALAQDLSDGTLDGVDASGPVVIGTTGPALPVDIQNCFATAMVSFHTHGFNNTGLGNEQIGNLPFAKVALTAAYKVEYIPDPMMGAMEGKTTFTLRVTDNAGDPVTTLAPTLTPNMYMTGANMAHRTPSADITNEFNGDYTVSIYYLMASQMMDGSSMGYWDLVIDLDGISTTTDDIVHFYPSVMMAMGGDTVEATLTGQTDKIIGMGMPVGRDYHIFKDKLMGSDGSYNFTVFIAATESMMSYPTLIEGVTLTDEFGGDFFASGIAVNMSIDDGTTWIPADNNGDGTWTTSTTLPLTNGVETQILVELTVSSETKTTNNLDYATFKVTPGGM